MCFFKYNCPKDALYLNNAVLAARNDDMRSHRYAHYFEHLMKPSRQHNVLRRGLGRAREMIVRKNK